jgi:hypothetical protein
VALFLKEGNHFKRQLSTGRKLTEYGRLGARHGNAICGPKLLT